MKRAKIRYLFIFLLPGSCEKSVSYKQVGVAEVADTNVNYGRPSEMEFKMKRPRGRVVDFDKVSRRSGARISDSMENHDFRRADQLMSEFVEFWKPIGKTKNDLVDAIGPPFHDHGDKISYVYTRIVGYRWDFFFGWRCDCEIRKIGR